MSNLEVFQGIGFDESIIREELHTYLPYGSSQYQKSDEIRIAIQCQDLITATYASHIYIEGKLSKEDVSKGAHITNNAFAFLFKEIRFEINGVVVDFCKEPGITSSILGLLLYNSAECRGLSVAGWSGIGVYNEINDDGTFCVLIPLEFLLGFARDYKKVLMNVRQELILIRSGRDENCYVSVDTEASIDISRIEWRVPHVTVNDAIRLELLKQVNQDALITMAFRRWEIYELPALKPTKLDLWQVRSSSNLEKPRYVVLGFQRNRKNNKLQIASNFDHLSITNIKLYLNSESYPYQQWNMDFDKNKYATAYINYINFQNSYLGRSSEPLMSYDEFKNNPLFILDCSKQNEAIKTSVVDVKIEMEGMRNFPQDAVVYALIIHDTIVEYRPLGGEVRKL